MTQTYTPDALWSLISHGCEVGSDSGDTNDNKGDCDDDNSNDGYGNGNGKSGRRNDGDGSQKLEGKKDTQPVEQ